MALSKLDRPFLNAGLLAELESSLGTKPVPLQVVLRDGDEFQGVQPLFSLKPDGSIEKTEVEGTKEAWMVSIVLPCAMQ